MASYSIYVTQQLFFYPAGLDQALSWPSSNLGVVLCLVLGSLVFVLIERPINRWGRRSTGLA